MNEQLLQYLNKPAVYSNSTSKFWDDDHISKGMLEAHLNPDWDAATRNHNFIVKSVDWIANIAEPKMYPKLLDLGCGPGLYLERFYNKGYQVTGVDFSRRSIHYAMDSAKTKGYAITYHYQNYLQITYQEEFDVITLIYCDICVLSDDDRKKLLSKVYHALKPNGKFIVDVNTPKVYQGKEESKTWSYNEGDFWCEKPHLCLNAFYRYDDSNTMLEQAVIITEDNVNSIYIWDHTFTLEELSRELRESGFLNVSFYGDVAGAEYNPDGNTICAVAVK